MFLLSTSGSPATPPSPSRPEDNPRGDRRPARFGQHVCRRHGGRAGTTSLTPHCPHPHPLPTPSTHPPHPFLLPAPRGDTPIESLSLRVSSKCWHTSRTALSRRQSHAPPPPPRPPHSSHLLLHVVRCADLMSTRGGNNPSRFCASDRSSEPGPLLDMTALLQT